MFCPNCGKKINDYDNFCKFCGKELRETSYIETPEKEIISLNQNKEKFTVEIPSVMQVKEGLTAAVKEEIIEVNEDDEIVVFEIKKHWMSLFWPLVLSPLCIAYFWKVYVVIQSFAGFLLGLVFLLPIVYPILRYYVDKAVITNVNLHIQQGVYDYNEISVPLNKIDLIQMRRSFLGKTCNYGHLIIQSEYAETRTVYKYIQDPDEVLHILRNPNAYIKKYLG